MLIYIWNVGFDILLIFVFYYLNKNAFKTFLWSMEKEETTASYVFFKTCMIWSTVYRKDIISPMESRQLELYEGFCSTYILELTKFSNF